MYLMQSWIQTLWKWAKNIRKNNKYTAIYKSGLWVQHLFSHFSYQITWKNRKIRMVHVCSCYIFLSFTDEDIIKTFSWNRRTLIYHCCETNKVIFQTRLYSFEETSLKDLDIHSMYRPAWQMLQNIACFEHRNKHITHQFYPQLLIHESSSKTYKTTKRCTW